MLSPKADIQPALVNDKVGDHARLVAFCLRGSPYWPCVVAQRNGAARSSNSVSPASLGSRGLPGWMIATWQLSAASTSWR